MIWENSLIKKFSSTNHTKLLSQLKAELKAYPLKKINKKNEPNTTSIMNNDLSKKDSNRLNDNKDVVSSDNNFIFKSNHNQVTFNNNQITNVDKNEYKNSNRNVKRDTTRSVENPYQKSTERTNSLNSNDNIDPHPSSKENNKVQNQERNSEFIEIEIMNQTPSFKEMLKNIDIR